MKNSFPANLLLADLILPLGKELSRNCLITIKKQRDLEVF